MTGESTRAVLAQTPGTFDELLAAVLEACRGHYGDRLISLAAFGSVGRGTARPDSDVDLLIVADGLPDGRMARGDDFAAVDAAIAPALAAAAARGVTTWVSPVFKTPQEIAAGSPLLLDMIEDARILSDRDGLLRQTLAALRARLDRRGARRIWRGNAWYWDLKPDYRPGDEFEV